MKVKEVNKLKELLSDSEQYRNLLYSDTDFSNYERYWMAEYPHTARDILTVPVMVSDANRQKATLFGSRFRAEVTTQYPDQVPVARIMTTMMNYIIRITHLMEDLRDCGQDTITCGTGLMLDGFGSEFGVSQQTAIEGFDPTRRDKDDNRIEYNDNVFDDLPWSKRLHPANFLVPPGTIRMEDAYGFFHKYVRHIDDVRRDDKLITKHRNKIEPDGAMDSISNEAYKASKDMVVLWDWHDLRTNHRTTFNLAYNSALYDEVDEIMLRINRLPAHSMIFNKNSRMFWGTSDFHLLEPLAQEINDIRTMQMKQRRAEVCKILLNKDAVEDTEDMDNLENTIKKLTSDQVAAIVEVHTGDKSLRDVLYDFKPSQAYDLIPQLDLAKKEIEEFGLQIGPTQKGLMSSGRHTKYETQVTEAHHDRAMAPRKDVVRETVVSIIENWAEMIYDFWTEQQTVQTWDAAGRPVMVEFRGADLRGDYRFDISLSSMRNKSQEEKTNEANMVLSQMGPFVQAGIINPQTLVRQYLSRAIGTDWDIESLMMQQQQAPQQPVGIDQYRQQFMRQTPQNQPSLQALISGQSMSGRFGQPQGASQ